ncbi:MAG: hypothetical protein K1X28_00075 [Parachlamydiales bacterium]|nr:hypothetical protein [Parachlamydiales bacterium]
MDTVTISPKIEKGAAGSLVIGGAAAATVSLLAAKSVIAIGLASNVIPIIGTIVGIAMMILGSLLFYRSWNSDQTVNPLKQKAVEPVTIRLPTYQKKMEEKRKAAAAHQKNFIALPGQKQKTDPFLEMQKLLDTPVLDSELPSVAANKTEKPASLDLTSADKIQAGANLAQWGLIGAAAFGVPGPILFPASLIAGLGSEIATFCSLPKDATWLRKAMSIPGLSRLLIQYNPWIPGWLPKIMQGVSLVNLAQHSIAKMGDVWRGFKTEPLKAAKAGGVCLFNLISGVAFAAEGAGLIKLRPQTQNESPEKAPCDPSKDEDCSGPINRKIRLISENNNVGPNANLRQAISDKTTANHREYAEKWKCEHDVIKKNLVEGQCKNPISGKRDNCSPSWNKIKYFKEWCDTPKAPGAEEWAIYTDQDGVYTNFQVDPSEAIDLSRGDRDSSFIIATEGENGGRFNPGAVNTGVMIVRKDPKGCEVIDRIWQNRNTITSDEKNCPTFGICENQNKRGEQAATDRVIWTDAPHLLKNSVTRILSRDATHPKRGNIALNTLNRGGCTRPLLADGSLGAPHDINTHDLTVNPDGIWKEGDWIGQTAGYPLYGQDLSHQPTCTENPNVPEEPLRIKKVDQMLRAAEKTLTADPRKLIPTVPFYQKIREDVPGECVDIRKPEAPKHYSSREITFGAVYDNSKDPNREHISAFVNQNHARYAKKWGLKHEVVAKNLVAGRCKTGSGETTDCAAYWNKMQMLREWLAEPEKPGVEEWRIYADDDMLVTNMGIDPSKAIDALRGRDDTSFIVAEDVIDWQRWFFEHPQPHKAVNTGLLIVRKDDHSRKFVEEVWAQRHRPVTSPMTNCENIGTCKFQDRSMQEQEAMAIVLRNRPSFHGNVVTVVPPRDTNSPTRSHLALNTFYRDGCFKQKDKIFSFRAMDQAENPQGAFQKGDWMTQTAGVPVWGKDIPFTTFLFSDQSLCMDKPEVQEGPVRLNKLKDLSLQVVGDEVSSGG